MKVKDVMKTDVKSCGSDANLAAISEVMFKNDCGILPVVEDGGRVAGIITDRDICIAVGTKGRLASDITAGEIISGKVFACTPDDDVRTALETMQKARVRRLPVVDRGGRLTGIISLSDAVRYAEKGSGRKPPALSYEDVVKTYKIICEQNLSRPKDRLIEKTAHA